MFLTSGRWQWRTLQKGNSALQSIDSNTHSRRRLILCGLLVSAFSSSTVAQINDRFHSACIEDAMLVVDASGSMSGIAELADGGSTTRIEKVRKALADTLPFVTHDRRLGLITYGPGGHCRTKLNMRPEVDAGARIISILNDVVPDGRTPLTSAVEQAANTLDYRNKPALIVLLTDGEETCGGHPCDFAERLKETGKAVTVNVIGYRMSEANWVGEEGITEMKCLAERTGGRYLGANSMDELVAALKSTLGCSLMSSRRTPASKFAQLPWQKAS
jgi:Ca-activated chloride channel family protein